MFALVRGLLLAALLAVSATSAAVDGEDNRAAHQVLVMLHLPAPHYRPDSGYSGSYGDDGAHAARRRIAEELAKSHGLVLVTDWPMPVLGIDCYVMEDPAHGTAAHMVEVLSRDKRIEWVQPMSTYHSLGNDPLFPAQPSSTLWHLNDLHRIATGRNVTVAVIDSGVQDDHPDLRGQVVLKENFVDGMPYAGEQHGTAVAGIIAAIAGNGVGIEGIAPNARVMALRACWQPAGSRAQCNSFTLGKALNFAIAHDARIINLSLGGPPDRLLERLLDVAMKKGARIVAAVDPQNVDGGFPASLSGVLAVASLESHGMAPRVLLAPGREIPTTAVDGGWNFVSGTSYAAAHMSGMLALLEELRPAMSTAQIEQQLVKADFDSAEGVDACATIGRITGNCPCSCTAAHVSKTTYTP
ncbi:MAG: S8 family serine peptidase [Burkholderiaceae bacterium]|nr:S8 family serine peptidase [Burkholderiaceae bacterium]